MAVTLKPLYPLKQARERRVELARYLKLDGGRYLIAAALLLALMSLLTLGQTGRLATQGYEIGQLQRERTALLRERSTLLLRLSEAQSLADVERRAGELRMQPMTIEQARYLTIGTEEDRSVVAAEQAPVATP